MKLAEIYLTSRDSGVRDELIQVYNNEATPELLKIKYSPSDIKDSYTFWLSRSGTLDYVEDLLWSINHDNDPYEYVQITLCTGPPIMYHACDLTDSRVRELISTQIERTLKTRCERS